MLFRSLHLEHFIPFQQLIGKSQVWLDNYVEPTSANKTICPGKREIHRPHDLCNTDGCAPRDANAAVDKCSCPVAAAAVCIRGGSMLVQIQDIFAWHRNSDSQPDNDIPINSRHLSNSSVRGSIPLSCTPWIMQVFSMPHSSSSPSRHMAVSPTLRI